MTMLPALQSDIGGKMNKAFGFDGWTLHDPTLGTVAITVDDMAAYGVIDFLDMNTWEMVEPFPGGASFDFLPGEMANIWSRTSYNNTNSKRRVSSCMRSSMSVPSAMCVFRVSTRLCKPYTPCG